jgi:hypothetical protein
MEQAEATRGMGIAGRNVGKKALDECGRVERERFLSPMGPAFVFTPVLITHGDSLAVEAKKLLHKWLNRRSQRKSMTWEKFNLMEKRFPLPRPRIRVSLFARPKPPVQIGLL